MLALLLLFGAAQCVAACTNVDCTPKAPPCHSHSQRAASVSCAPDYLAVSPQQHAPVTLIFSAWIPAALTADTTAIFIARPSTLSPPEAPPASTRILRI